MNGLNQYTSAGTAAFTYDLNGNLTADGTNAYTYDIENRLVKAVSGGATTNLVYDPLGRLWQVVRGSADTRFIYDGDALVTEYDAAGTALNRYAHGPNAGADDPLVWFSGAGLLNKRYLHADHLGSIVAATNGTSAPGINAYDEYGVPETDAATHTVNLNSGRFQYTGQAFIPELGAGMYYYKARMYSAFLGRFLQTDPIGYEGGVNVYAYVGNDPTNGADPSGLGPEIVACAATGPLAIPCGIGDLVATGFGLWALTHDSWRGTVPFTWAIAREIGAYSRVKGSVHVYRLYSSDWKVDPNTSGPNGKSWTTWNPRLMFDPKNELGLPAENKADRLTEGDLFDFTGVGYKPAEAIGQNSGGSPELVIPDPARQVKNRRYSKFNPDKRAGGAANDNPPPLNCGVQTKCYSGGLDGIWL